MGYITFEMLATLLLKSLCAPSCRLTKVIVIVFTIIFYGINNFNNLIIVSTVLFLAFRNYVFIL